MSALEHLWPRSAVKEPTPEVGQAKATLKAVPEPARPQKVARAPFVVFLCLLIGAGMFGLVVLNTAIQSQAQQLAELNSAANRTQNEKAALTSQVQILRSSTSLTQKAQALGMRPNPFPAFIVLPDGRVLGTPTTVVGNELPDQTYETWLQLQTKQENARAQVAAQAKAAEEARKKKAAEEAKKKAEAEAAKKKAAAEEAARKKAAANPSASPSPAPTPAPTPSSGR